MPPDPCGAKLRKYLGKHVRSSVDINKYSCDG
jgi:hypothetical protein